jgi:hypothetical protein
MPEEVASFASQASLVAERGLHTSGAFLEIFAWGGQGGSGWR